MQIDENKKIPMLPPYKVKSRVTIMAEVQDYNHKLMNIPAMWKRTRGAGVKVVVLDSGIPSHPDLRTAGGKSFIRGYSRDANGHSTHVGGIIAAIADNNMGVAGIAPECEIYYGAVLDGTGSGDINSIINGIRWAVNEVGAQVINMSLGIPAGMGHSYGLEEACNYALSRGCVIVCAAGNEGGAVAQPASYSSVITVAAVNSFKEHAWFSNTGEEIDFAAGGVNVYSTWLNNGYARLDGTSMATPAITGLVALIQADYKQNHRCWLPPTGVYTKLKKIAYDVGPEGYDTSFGYGIPVFGTISDYPLNESDEIFVEVTPKKPTKKSPLCGLVGQFLTATAASLRSGTTLRVAIGAGIRHTARAWNLNYRRKPTNNSIE